MDNQPKRSSAGFSMLEVLVVSGIIVLLAGLIVGLAGVTGDKKKVNGSSNDSSTSLRLIEELRLNGGLFQSKSMLCISVVHALYGQCIYTWLASQAKRINLAPLPAAVDNSAVPQLASQATSASYG